MKKPKVIAISAQKGGVGKSTTTYNLSTLFANAGYKVLDIDSDSQASLTLMMGFDPLTMSHNLASIYDGDDVNSCIYVSPVKNLDFIPSSISLAKTENQLMTVMIGREKKLSKAIHKIADNYDYIFIDCPPALGLLTINALVACDVVIAPCETTNLSIYALDDLVETIDETKESNPNLYLMGIVATKYVSNSISHKKALSEIKSRFDLLGIIKNTVSAQAGSEDGLPCVIADPHSIAANGYKELYKTIINKLEER